MLAWDDSGMLPEPGQNPSETQALPLFPLGTVVFPGALLPLQIFELRYLRMMGECEREGRPFGIVTLTRGGEVHRPGRPADTFEPIGTQVRLEKVLRPRAGLLQVWCRASSCFEVLDKTQGGDGLWRAQVRDLPAEPPIDVPEHLRYLSDLMVDALRKLSSAPLDPVPWPEPWSPQDCAWLSHRWGELLPLPAAMKYRLLALRQPLLRLELVGDMVSPQSEGA